MNVEAVREYCISLKGVTEHFPFDDVSLVFKVEGKMFALLSFTEIPPHLSVKCDPDIAILLRDRFAGVVPAWHFNKRHWNRVYIESDVEEELVKWCIRHSYGEVLKKLPKRIQQDYPVLQDDNELKKAISL